MSLRDALATALVLVCATGCAVNPGEDAEEAPVSDEPLDVTVDSVDVLHGALRIAATMTNGSADVSLALGGECAHTDVGGGISTVSSLVWTFAETELASAIACGLVVRARVRDGSRTVERVADLSVAVDVYPLDEGAEGILPLESFASSDLARAVLRHRTMDIDGSSFGASVSVAGTSLEDDEPSETP